MKLVIATPLYPPEIGGPATYAKLLEEGLPPRGIEVELVKFSEIRYLPKLIRHYTYYRRVLKAARSADVVLALDPVSVGLPAMKAAKKAGKPFVVKIVGDYAWEQGTQRFGVTQNLDEFVQTHQASFAVRILQKIQIRVARSATRVVVPSNYLKGIIEKWGISGEKIEVIYNAVPLEALGAVPEAVASLPRPLVVSVGRLVPWKHVDQVIDAVANIPNASLGIVGDGPQRVALAERVHEKLTERAVFTGILPRKDARAVIKSADVLVLNSSYEGLSHLLIEALMLGVPIVATRVGGNPEVVTHGEDGLLISANDTVALTNALTQLLSDTELRSRLSAQAKESAKRFLLETMLSRTTTTLQNI